MIRKSHLGLWLYVILAGLAAMAAGLNVNRNYSASPSGQEVYHPLNRFGYELEIVRECYVEKPDDEILIESATNGMMSSLDPHSGYLNPRR